MNFFFFGCIINLLHDTQKKKAQKGLIQSHHVYWRHIPECINECPMQMQITTSNTIRIFSFFSLSAEKISFLFLKSIVWWFQFSLFSIPSFYYPLLVPFCSLPCSLLLLIFVLFLANSHNHNISILNKLMYKERGPFWLNGSSERSKRRYSILKFACHRLLFVLIICMYIFWFETFFIHFHKTCISDEERKTKQKRI